MTRFCIRSKRRNILPSRKRFSLAFAGRKKVPRGVINWISCWVWHNIWAKEMSLDWFPRCDADIIGREGMLHRPVVRVYRSVISAFACCPYGFLMNERHTQWQHYQGQSQSITSERGVCLKSETKFTFMQNAGQYLSWFMLLCCSKLVGISWLISHRTVIRCS